MKIAIPLFGSRISPRFDFSPETWILTMEHGDVVHQEKIPMTHLTLGQRLDHLASHGVTKIICGGIDGYCVSQLGNRGIDVVPNVAGEAKEAFQFFLKGMLRPGFCCDRRRRKGCSPWRQELGGRRN